MERGLNIQDLLDNVIESEYTERDHPHWHASRLGNCPTGQYLERMGKAPDAPFTKPKKRQFYSGKIFENLIVDAVSKTDVKVETQVECSNQALDIMGHTDLVVTYPNKLPVVYEIKSRHSWAFKYIEAQPNRQHAKQLWSYLWMMDLPLGILLYISRDDLRIVEHPVLLSDPALREEVLGELKLLNTAWETKQVPELVNPEPWWEKYCSYHQQCKQYAAEVV